MKRHIRDVIILGAGASGLICAHITAQAGLRTLVIDHAREPGRKLAVTGGGKCNFTNRRVSEQDYTGGDPAFCRPALAGWTPDHGIALMAEAGIPFEEREHGQLFGTKPAAGFAHFLARRCRDAGCVFVLAEKVVSAAYGEAGPDHGAGRSDGHGMTGKAGMPGAAEPDTTSAIHAGNGMPSLFTVHTTERAYQSRHLVVALGGPAWPQTGATTAGGVIARSFGHRVIPARPALAGFVLDNAWPLRGLDGISLPVSIGLSGGARPERRAVGRGRQGGGPVPAAAGLPMLFTRKGISGPAALQASLYWRKGMVLNVDFLPALCFEKALDLPGSGKLLLRNFLKKHLPDRLAVALCPSAIADLKCASLSRSQRNHIHGLVHAYPVHPLRTEGFAKAEVAAGGISTSEVVPASMESRLVPGLFFCGEVLDVTGRLGGYNLHWAFASGMVAGKGVVTRARAGR